MINETFYFATSAFCAGAKTMWYAFTIPSSISKVVERSNSYKSHKESLTKIAEETNKQSKPVKEYIDLGDLVGFIGGLSGVSWYAVEALQHPNMTKVWLLANGISLGYEVARVLDKTIRRNNRLNIKDNRRIK